jgi:uncharacterized phage protein (TIGR01671 family)
MNREIKFRAWDKFNKKWVSLLGTKELNAELGCYGIGNGRFWLLNNADYIWVQYTGMRDRDNEEIWEGDIVQSDRVKEVKGTVIFEHGEFTTDAGHLSIARGWAKTVVVIGNIYENLELQGASK